MEFINDGCEIEIGATRMIIRKAQTRDDLIVDAIGAVAAMRLSNDDEDEEEEVEDGDNEREEDDLPQMPRRRKRKGRKMDAAVDQKIISMIKTHKQSSIAKALGYSDGAISSRVALLKSQGRIKGIDTARSAGKK